VISKRGKLTVRNEDIAQVTTPVTSCRHFGDKDGSDASKCTCTKSGYNTGNKDKIARLSGRLESTAYQSKESCDEKPINSANSISSPAADESSNDGTEVILVTLVLA
jgi:hypothetical protein